VAHGASAFDERWGFGSWNFPTVNSLVLNKLQKATKHA
jgi:hypothetical protein